ncbi:MAG: glutamate 5-kinase [Eubacterium sp.]|nr:glutamate 5-kinase [Eubacterium sp.]
MRIVVKVGTSTLAYPTGCLDIRHVEILVKTLSDLKNAGNEIVLVSSGAIGMGTGRLSLKERPEDMPTKQAAASVGQCELMYTYDRLFGEYNHIVGQILLTGEDFAHADRKQNFENTILRLIELGVIPVVNENDTIATDEISVGENDTLAAMVACSVNADLLVLLSDIDGLYTKDPHKCEDAQLIPLVEQITPALVKLADGKGSSLGTGGMVTKLHAAEIVMEHGVDMIIANGARPRKLYNIVEGEPVGTRFLGKTEK